MAQGKFVLVHNDESTYKLGYVGYYIEAKLGRFHVRRKTMEITVEEAMQGGFIHRDFLSDAKKSKLTPNFWKVRYHEQN
jgi:hypothetical protein